MELYWRDCHQFQSLNEENENDIPTFEAVDGAKVLTSNKNGWNEGHNRLISGLSASLPTEKEYQEVIVKSMWSLII